MDNLDLLHQTMNDAEVSRRRLVDFRRRISNNEAIPPEELSEALLMIRNNFGSEAKAKAKAAPKPKAAKAPKASSVKLNGDDLLNDILGGL